MDLAITLATAQSWVQGVTQRVSQEGECEHDQGDGQTGKDGQPRGELQVPMSAHIQHAAP